MRTKKIIIRSIAPLLDEAWTSSNFDKVDHLSRQIDFQLMELSRQLRAGFIDCLWYAFDAQIIVWTRSLKNNDTIQITSFDTSGDSLIANHDFQASSYEELIRESPDIYQGVVVNTISWRNDND